VLGHSRELVDGLRLKSNASVTTRGDLEQLNGMVGIVFEMLRSIEKQVGVPDSSDADTAEDPSEAAA
jgi:ribosomal protein L30/L7E